jgi:hypothetical protein
MAYSSKIETEYLFMAKSKDHAEIDLIID